MKPGQIPVLPAVLHGLEVAVEVGESSDIPGLLDEVTSRGGHAAVLLRGFPPDALLPNLARAPTIVLDVRTSTLPLEALVFELRTRLTLLRASARGPVRLVVEPPEALAPALLDQPSAGYWDALVVPDAGRAASSWLRSGSLESAGRVLDLTRTAKADRWLVQLPDDAGMARRAMGDLSSAAQLLGPGLVVGGAGVTRVSCNGRLGEVYLNPNTLDRVALLRSCPEGAPVTIEPPSRAERVELGSGDALVRVTDAASDRFAIDTSVAARRRLTVEEIVARHQAAAVRQAASVRTLISSGTLTITFEAPGFPAPVTVSSETTIFKDATRTDLEQREIRVNGIAFRSQGIPRLPIIEPERVSAPPLAITLGDKYRYRLVGDEPIAGVRSYVVAFEPLSGGEPLFRGRAWISAEDFGIVRVEASETALRGAVVSSEQVDEFTRTGEGAWVLARSDVRQLYQGAAYRTPIRRVLALPTHDVNAPDFDMRRQTAYSSEHTILRDTSGGYRYLEGETRRAAATGISSSPAARSATGTASRVRTLAFGVIVDPNISRPLPFAGLSYLDFNLFGTGAQLNGFFGGTYGQMAFSVPSLRGSRWQLAARAFGIASSYNDRDFEAGREQYDRNVRQRPAFASVWLLRPLTPRLSFRAGYDLDYTHFARSDVTASDFAAPADQIAHGVRVGLEGQRAGWDGTIWWSGMRRSGWRPWGWSESGEYRLSQRDFQRYGGSIARSVIFSPMLLARGEVTLTGGHDLDRFSQYSFGTFDNRLHGYPSALIRYDRGATLRSSLAWSPGRLFRLDGFADAAFVRDTGFARGVSRFAGIGAAIEAPAPFGTLVAAEWGYGFQGINSDGRRGTHVVRVTGYKVF